MKKLCSLLSVLLLLSVVPVKGQLLHEGFESTCEFASMYDTLTNHGITYTNAGTHYSSLAAVAPLAGSGGFMMYCQKNSQEQVSFVKLQKSAGGIGLIHFCYRGNTEPSGAQTVPLKIQKSSDGDDWTDVDEIEVPVSNDWNVYSFVVNDANAQYVRLFYNVEAEPTWSYPMPTYVVSIDELYISDNGVDPNFAFNVTVPAKGVKTAIGTPLNFNITLTGAGIPEAGVTLNLEAPYSTTESMPITPTDGSLSKTVSITFNPDKYDNKQNMAVIVDTLGTFYYVLSGTGLQRNIYEGFNDIADFNSTTKTYHGWKIGDANDYNGDISAHGPPFEGTHCALASMGSIISPEKAGGIGEIAFWYKNYSTYSDATFTVSVSSDGETWTQLGNTITATAEYQKYYAKVDSVGGKYVKVYSSSYSQLCVDAFEISPSGEKIPGVSAQEVITSYTATPYQFTVPMEFAGVSGLVYLTTNDTLFTPTRDSVDDPSGIVQHSLTFTPAADEDFASASLTVSGGNIASIKNIPITVYEELSSVSEGFDSVWGNEDYNTGNYLTYYGWKIEKGARYANGGVNGYGDGAVVLSDKGIVYPRPLKEGIGDIVYYAKPNGWSNGAVKTYVSEDRKIWIEKDSVFLTSGGSYEKHVIVVQNNNAKWVKIVAEGSYAGATEVVSLDNISIIEYGEFVADVKNVGPNVVSVIASTSTEGTFTFRGHGFSSNPTITLKQGTAFSINGKTDTVVNTADINDKDFVLPVTVNTASGTSDTIVISGGGLENDISFIVKAVVFVENAFINFDEAWEGSSEYCSPSGTTIDGWAIVNGYRNTESGSVGFGSAGCLSLCDNGSLTTPPMANGAGDVQVFIAQYSDGSAKIDTSADGINWGEFLTFPVTGGNNYNVYTITVGSPTVQYVRLGSSYTRIENVTVKEYGGQIPYITLGAAPEVQAEVGEVKELKIPVSGYAISEDVTISFKTGEFFSASLNPVPADSLNNREYNLSVLFSATADAGSYFEDVVSLTSAELGVNYDIKVSGIVLRQYISQDFENMTYNSTDWKYYGDGWFTDNVNSTGGADNSKWASLSSSYKILSVAKAGGVGEISFVYAQSSSWQDGDSKVIINTYETLDGEATQVDTFTFSSKTLTEKTVSVSSQTAKYVEFKVLSGVSVGFDNILITPYGKGVPAIALQDIDGSGWVEPVIYAYSGEEKEVEFKILTTNLEGTEVGFKFVDEGAEIEISPLNFTPASNKDSVNITVTWTGGVSTDAVLRVFGSVTKDFRIAHFVTYADTIIENFDGIENILTTNSGYTIDPTPFGIKHGFVAEWCKALKITNSGEYGYGVCIVSPKGGVKYIGVLTSPEKLHGVSEIKFVYSCNARGGVIIQVSEDGSIWMDLDTIVASNSEIKKYSKSVDYPDAKYVRWQGYGDSATYDDYDSRVIIDSVFIAGFPVQPYLNLTNTVEPQYVSSTEPLEIEISLEGELIADASVSLLNGSNGFSCDKEKITVVELLLGDQTVTFNVTFTAAENGNYKDTLRIESEGVATLVIPLEVTRTVVANDIARSSNNLSCYFTENALKIKGAAKGEYIRVSDVLGKVLYTGKAKGGNEVIYTNSPRGVYMITVGNKTVKLLK
ncbi:MAG: T9SS type A sorting domain-containing protein [Bacteroidales bacterium]|jgi:hypothetical protein|nr:T9SS type A sorting domain-containing protein [Bacteroidales bacterium]